MSKHFWFTVAASSLIAGSAFSFTFDGSNWVVNGDFEATGAGNMNKTVNPLFGWEVGGWMNNNCTNSTVVVRNYSTVWDWANPNSVPGGWSYDGPSASSRGNNFLTGGVVTGNNGGWWVQGMRQLFWIYGNNEAISKIDAGNLKFSLSAYLGGFTEGPWAGTQSGAKIILKCTGTYSGSQEFSLGQINTQNAGSGKTYWSNLDYQVVEGVIPVGTRAIELFVLMNHWGPGWSGAGNTTDPNYNYAAVDNIKFNVGQPVPEPMSMIALGLGAVGLIARRRRK